MDITFIDETNTVSETKIKEIEELLQFAAKNFLYQMRRKCRSLFMDNPSIQEINRTYRGKDAPTDVISFALEDEGEDEIPVILKRTMSQCLVY